MKAASAFPLLARWPDKIKAGQINSLPAVFYDVMPTFCEVAEIPTPRTTNVSSLLPTLTDKGKQRQHEFLFRDFAGYGGQQAGRWGDWKGLRCNLKRGASAIELYQLKKIWVRRIT